MFEAAINPSVCTDIQSPFFRRIIKAWIECTDNLRRPDTLDKIVPYPLWGNKYITDRNGKAIKPTSAFLNAGIVRISDIINDNGKFVDFQELILKGVPFGQYMNFFAIKEAIPKKWKSILSNDPPYGLGMLQATGPTSPLNDDQVREGAALVANHHVLATPELVGAVNSIGRITVMVNKTEIKLNKLNRRHLYTNLLHKLDYDPSKFRQKLVEDYGIGEDDQVDLNNLPKRTTNCTSLRDFIWRSTHGLVYSNKELKRFKFRVDGLCSFCDSVEDQSKEHLFVECEKVRQFWEKVIEKFSSIYDEEPNDLERLVGLYKGNTFPLIRTFITTCVRRYIYHCNVHNTELSLCELVRRITNLQKVEYDIAERNFKPEALVWHLNKWEPILVNFNSP